MDEIILVFKTHLDLGFTDFAQKIRRRYLEEFIPAALALAKQTRGREERFVWTVGAWLFQQYRAFCGDSEGLEEAVRQGDIRWHGLPFTTHTEYMTPELLESGLGLSRQLDERYGLTTIAAKMTDVPGHTRAMIPLLAKAGIRFLHIGVNPASTVPQVPKLFWWQAPGGERVLTMYNGDYGELTPIGNSGTAVYFAHTGDNRGPQGVENLEKIYADLRARFPGAKLRAGTLEDVAHVALAQENLPVVTGEIGDTWIHGTGTDPAKTSAFRGLLRLAQTLPREQREPIYQALLPVPEHTWGLDEKTHLSRTYPVDFRLGEHDFFCREDFWRERSSPRFQKMEMSWQEQRQYVRDGCAAFPEACRRQAEAVLTQVSRPLTDVAGWETCTPGQRLDMGDFSLTLDETGALDHLTWRGRHWAAAENPLFRFHYEVFSEENYSKFREEYVTSDEPWALEDFGKIGMAQANRRYRRYQMEVKGIYRWENQIVLRGQTPEESWARFGCPRELELKLVFGPETIGGDFAWLQKPASRVAEALWLEFCPMASVQAVHKLGQWISPLEVVEGGNKKLHATQDGVRFSGLTIQGLDTGLVSLGGPGLLGFSRENPHLEQGVWFNLYNNVWGTNFPMWYDQDGRFRFLLNFS